KMISHINTEQGPRYFVLDQYCGLRSHYSKEAPFDSSVEEAFFRGFQKRKTAWIIEREAEILDLGETVFIPDFKLSHPDGREFLLEIVGFWTPEYLQKKMEKIRMANHPNLIVAVNHTLNCAKSDFSGTVLFFKTRVRVRDVLSLLGG
ncbi:MAG TPA: DUF790 family protein, partial [bacterium]